MRQGKWLAVVAVMGLLVAGCTGGAFSGGPASPSKEHIVAMAALLPPQQAEELRVWGKAHRNMWNGDVHSGKTCPIFVYTPAFYRHAAGQMSDLEWAEFLHKTYKYKHREEGHCDCDEQLQKADKVTVLKIPHELCVYHVDHGYVPFKFYIHSGHGMIARPLVARE